MNEINTRYGLITGLTSARYYENGEMSSCELKVLNEVHTNYGPMIPFYESDGRRFKSNGLYFYKDGNLKSVDLQKQTEVKTKVGMVPAEKVIFYSTGNIKRIFPLNGDISGFWTEVNESELTKSIDIQINDEIIHAKCIGLYFYNAGSLKSITLWPKEILRYNTPVGVIQCIIGVSFYPNGSLHSCEPARPILVNTPIGKIFAFNNNAIGVNGDINSLQFYNDGRLKSLITDCNSIEIFHNGCLVKTVKPKLIRSFIDFEKKDIISIKIDFDECGVTITSGESLRYSFEEYDFRILPFITKEKICTDCSNCTSCG